MPIQEKPAITDMMRGFLDNGGREHWAIKPELDAIERVKRTMADLSIGPNELTVRGPTYCPHCGAPPAEHHNGVCLRFPAMQPPLA